MRLSSKALHAAFALAAVLISGCSTYRPVQPTPQETTPLPPPFFPPPSDSIGRPKPADQCGVGCPIGGTLVTLYRDVYTLNNNSDTKFANWVAYHVTKDSQQSGRPRNWARDPDLPETDTLSPPAYRDANAVLSVDRGHQAPLAALARLPDWPALNYLSNITPQKAALNQGAWNRLEEQERRLANLPAIAGVYVVTGPLFEAPTPRLPAVDVAIPSGYFKIIYLDPSPMSAPYAAFVMPQDTPRNASFCSYQITVADIEARTGFKFWTDLPPIEQLQLKSAKGELARQMGCS